MTSTAKKLNAKLTGKRRTSHGATMSPRMERLWIYIRDVRQISLADFSTDECVERVIGALQSAHDAVSGDSHQDEELRRDLRAIMRRRPHDRVVASNRKPKRAKPKKAKPVAKPQTQQSDDKPSDPTAALLNALDGWE